MTNPYVFALLVGALLSSLIVALRVALLPYKLEAAVSSLKFAVVTLLGLEVLSWLIEHYGTSKHSVIIVALVALLAVLLLTLSERSSENAMRARYQRKADRSSQSRSQTDI